MREELLAHLTLMFNEELACGGDELIATARAIDRFGDATSLARELQASVPWLERWAFFSFPYSGPIRRRPGESPMRFIVRANTWAWMLSAVGYAAIALEIAIVGSLRRPGRIDPPTSSQLIMFLMGAATIQLVAMIVLGLLSEGNRQRLERYVAAATAGEKRKAAWGIVGYTTAGSVALAASFAALLLLIEAFLPFPFVTRFQFWGITLATVGISIPLILAQAWSWTARARRFENWDSLDIDEQPAA
jgi:hypothetical protein